MSQDAQLTRAVKTRSSTATAAPALKEQTSDQPAVTQTEANSSSSPVDLSNKKSPEAKQSNRETPSIAAAATTAQGKYQ